MQSRFKVFKQFERPELVGMIRSRHRLGHIATEVFAGERIHDRFVRALAERQVLNAKEILESFEFHRRVRRRIRQPVVVDLCCGHGLVGVLFALLETSVEQVILVDRTRPASVDAIIDAASSLAPWVSDKITFLESDVADAAPLLPTGAGVVGVHACGPRTDEVMDVALALGGPVAVMPCCYRTARGLGPEGIRATLGTHLAHDVDRSYRLAAAGLQVDWDAIPEQISPMSRILIGWQPMRHSADEAAPC